jgi:hypothetical protein
MIDRHVLAAISIVGNSLDVIGALYLAYDLLGGQHGPLRTLTRSVTYGVLFGVGYGIVLGPIFGLVTGIAHGVTLAWEYSRASRQGPKPGLLHDATMSSIRGLSFGIGAGFLYGATFGIAFGAFSAAGQTVAYRFGIRPTLDYAPGTRPRLTKHQFLAVVNRTVGYAIAGYISALFGHQRNKALSFGVEVGLAIGAVTAIVSACTPFTEWTADHMPEKRMGVLGIGLILVGFTLQSVQYWVTVLNIAVN